MGTNNLKRRVGALFRSKNETSGAIIDPRESEKIQKFLEQNDSDNLFRKFPDNSIGLLLFYEQDALLQRDDSYYDLYCFLIDEQIVWQVYGDKRKHGDFQWYFSDNWEQISE